MEKIIGIYKDKKILTYEEKTKMVMMVNALLIPILSIISIAPIIISAHAEDMTFETKPYHDKIGQMKICYEIMDYDLDQNCDELRLRTLRNPTIISSFLMQ